MKTHVEFYFETLEAMVKEAYGERYTFIYTEEKKKDTTRDLYSVQLINEEFETVLAITFSYYKAELRGLITLKRATYEDLDICKTLGHSTVRFLKPDSIHRSISITKDILEKEIEENDF